MFTAFPCGPTALTADRCLQWAKQHVPAILTAWYPGSLGGDAIINTLIGRNNPGGKTVRTTTVTATLLWAPFPHARARALCKHECNAICNSAGYTVLQPTCFDNTVTFSCMQAITWYDDSILSRSMFDMELNSGDGLTHLYYSKQPLFEFGWGLSYTTFSYTWSASELGSNLTGAGSAAVYETEGLAAVPAAAGGEAAVANVVQSRCTVKNTGVVAGDAVVLAVGETVILLHPPSTFSGCFTRDGERASAK